MPLIKTFNEACKVKGIDPKKVLPDVSAYPKEHRKALVAMAKLFIINEVLNDGWKPNWNDRSEWKYYPWFDMEVTKDNPTGFSFCGSGYGDGFSTVGSRLVYKNSNMAKYAGTQFEALYKDVMVL